MELYQHDGAKEFRFQICGELTDGCADELEEAWHTAASALRGKEIQLDITELTSVSARGMQVIDRMRSEGARVVARGNVAEPALACTFGIEAPATHPDPLARKIVLWGRRLLRRSAHSD